MKISKRCLSTISFGQLISMEYGLKLKTNNTGVFEGQCAFNPYHDRAVYTDPLGKEGLPSFGCLECKDKGYKDVLDLFELTVVEKYCAPKIIRKSNKNNVNDIAETILDRYSIIATSPRNIFIYNGKYWEPIYRESLLALALKEEGRFATNLHRRNEVASYISAKVLQNNPINWRQIKNTEIPLKNGIFDVVSKEIRPFDKNDFLEFVFDVPFVPSEKCSNWDSCLLDWFNNADLKCEDMSFNNSKNYQETKMALQEFLGYILMPKALYKKALILYGKPDTGKSVIGSLLTEFIGVDKITAIRPKEMNEPKKVYPIKGKCLNYISDLDSNEKINDGGFKKLVSTGDPIMIDGKFRDQETYIPFAKHIFATNTLPCIDDPSSATFERILIIRFYNVILKEDQNPQIISKLKNELSGILNWMIDGLCRLHSNNGVFTVPQISELEMKAYKIKENPINEFLDEFVEKLDGYQVSIHELSKAYTKYKGGRLIDTREVSKMLKKAGYCSTPRKENGRSVRVIKGFKILWHKL